MAQKSSILFMDIPVLWPDNFISACYSGISLGFNG